MCYLKNVSFDHCHYIHCITHCYSHVKSQTIGITVVPVTSTLLISDLPATSNLFLSLQVIIYNTKLPRQAPAPPRATSLCRKIGGCL